MLALTFKIKKNISLMFRSTDIKKQQNLSLQSLISKTIVRYYVF